MAPDDDTEGRRDVDLLGVLTTQAAALAADGASPTREEFWDVAPAGRALFYALAALSVAIFCFGWLRPLLKYRQGRPDYLPPRRELFSRLGLAVRSLLSHSTIARRAKGVGWAHRGILFGFAVLFAGTLILMVNSDFTEPLFGWRFFQGNFYLGYSFVLDVFGAALLVGIIYMIIRRGVVRPERLDYQRPDRPVGADDADRRRYRVGDWVFLSSLIYLAVTGFLLEGVRIAMENPGYNAANPVGWAASLLFAPASLEVQEVLRHFLWWSHGVVALTLVASIPFTKAMHIVTSFAGMVLKDPLAGKRLRAIPERLEAEPAGYSTLSDLFINHLVQLDACTKCGRCHEVCPARATGRPLSPRDVVLELREQANGALAGASPSDVFSAVRGKPSSLAGFALPIVGDDKIREDTIWSCMQCNACVEICPVGVEQAPIINQIRQSLVEEGRVDSGLQTTFQNIAKTGNSFGENKRRRGKWTAELDFEIKDARKEPVDVLWFVGDYASFDPRSQQVSRTIARLYQAAGVDFGILFDGERNAGNDVRRAGEEGLFEELAQQNIATLEECDFNRIVTSDPHTLNALRNDYPALGASYQVSHHTTFLLELIRSGRLPVAPSVGETVTYHDPCYLGRHNGEYDAPREILRELGCTLVEMPRNRDNSFCCGAGGGRIWINDNLGTERPSENRMREAASLSGVSGFVVSCPKDVTMFEDAIKTSGREDSMTLFELTELIEQAHLRAVGAGTAAP